MKSIWKAEEKCFLTALLILFAIIVLKNAWVCDDAYISFRVVDNFVNGYGLTWNIAERVQVFTHPLWVFIHIIVYSIAGHIYFTTLFISLVCVVTMVGWLSFKIAGNVWAAGAGVATLALSKAFVDYSTSGLENPLTFLLLTLFFYVFIRKEQNFRSFFYLGLLASLAAFNRMDTILLCLPPLVYAFWKIRGKKAVYILILAFLPLIFWELFSLFYYGFPFPNTAYAKLNTGLESGYFIRQGFAYLVNSLGVDPLSSFVLVSAVVIAVIRGKTRTIMIALGIFLFLVYIVRIGGCFMAGRHLAAPVLVSVILLLVIEESLPKRYLAACFAGVLLLGLTSPYSPLYFKTYDEEGENPHSFNSGIFDERIYYHQHNGLVNYDSRAEIWPSHPWAEDGRELREQGDTVIMRLSVGMAGFFAGPSVHIVDENGLTDAFLARLPVYKNIKHRIGHFRRATPKGYKKTLETGDSCINDEYMAEYYDKLSIVVKGDLYSWKRIEEIFKFNLGVYDHLIDKYNAARLIRISLSDISQPKEQGILWMEAGNTIFDTSGLAIDLEGVHYSCKLEMSRDNNDALKLVFVLNEIEVASVNIDEDIISGGGLVVSEIIVPREAVKTGYDHLLIYPTYGDGMYSIGHIRLLDDDCD